MYICSFCRYVGKKHYRVSKEEKERSMSRLSIEVTTEQHQRLKAIAALSGCSMKEYVLERTLPPVPDHDDLSEADALRQLAAMLQPRLEAARRGEVVHQSVEQIFDTVRLEAKP